MFRRNQVQGGLHENRTYTKRKKSQRNFKDEKYYFEGQKEEANIDITDYTGWDLRERSSDS